MMEIRNLSKQFGRIRVLNSVSARLQPASVYALIGPNGSGKSTLLKCILGLVTPDEGDILLNHESVTGKWKYREQIGYMAQISRYPENMTPAQIISMVKDVRKHRQEYDLELYEAFGIKKFEHKPMHSLSGGMRQKVGACLAFMFKPAVIILDEPTAGLDPLSSEMLKEKIIREKNTGALLIITSHILSDLDEMVSHVIYLNEGVKMVDATLDELRTRTHSRNLSQAIATMLKEERHA